MKTFLLFAALTVASLARAQYDEPGYHSIAFLSSPDKICNCRNPTKIISWSGSVPSYDGWLTTAGPCSNDGVAVDWNHYGSGTTYFSWSKSAPAGIVYTWAIAYATSSPNVDVPLCANGQKPVVTNPYTAVFIQLSPQSNCPSGPPGV